MYLAKIAKAYDHWLLDHVFTPLTWWHKNKFGRTRYQLASSFITVAAITLFVTAAFVHPVVILSSLFFSAMMLILHLRLASYSKDDSDKTWHIWREGLWSSRIRAQFVGLFAIATTYALQYFFPFGDSYYVFAYYVNIITLGLMLAVPLYFYASGGESPDKKYYRETVRQLS